jgi:hypothetical protein
MEQVDMHGQLINWKFLSCFASQETIRQGETSRGETSGHKSGGLVSVLALGPSACPKNARDLTLNSIAHLLIGSFILLLFDFLSSLCIPDVK